MAAAQQPQVIVVGGGLAGLSAAHTVVQNGGRVLLLDKSAFLGGNSTKATSGINGAGTKAQADAGIPDTKEIFEEDTLRSALGIKTGDLPPGYPLAKVLSHQSAAAVEWINERFGLPLDTVSRLGGHSYPRTHRAKSGGQFPGMMITYALMEKIDEIAEKQPHLARVITKARASRLLTNAQGAVIGVEYVKDGQTLKEYGAVVLASGGYAAGGLFNDSLLKRIRPDLMNLPTTNGVHCTGDGIQMALEIGGGAVDLKHVQVHPTGLVHPKDPQNRVKFLAAEALRGEGGLLLDGAGKRFCNELGTRDYVTGMMWQHQGPFYLVLNAKAAEKIAWHVRHYVGRGVMTTYPNGAAFAKAIGISEAELKASFDAYNECARSNSDPWNKQFFNGAPFTMDEELSVGITTPVVHYTMGGVKIDDEARVQKAGSEAPVHGLFAAGEATGGVHGRNRLGGSALLECVVFGRVAGASAHKYLSSVGAAAGAGGASAGSVSITVPQANGQPILIQISGSGGASGGSAAADWQEAPAGVASGATQNMEELSLALAAGAEVSTPSPPAHADGPVDGERMSDAGASGAAAAKKPAAAAGGATKEYTLEEVAKHVTEDDCWLVVNGQVLDVTDFLDDHPGGKMAVMTFAGKDASEEFNMVHDRNVVEKYAKECIIGVLKPSSRL